MEETWLMMVLASLCLCLCLCCAMLMLMFTIIFRIIRPPCHLPDLPPGPLHIPLVTSILRLTSSSLSVSQLRPLVRKLHAKHGPIITLRICSRPVICISDPSLAHQALLQNAALFADRPKTTLSNHQQLNISSSSYGATWRLLRRNLASQMLHPSRFASFSALRERVLDDLLNRFMKSSSISHCSSSSVRVIDLVHPAVFSLLVLMCFGDSVEKSQIQHIKHVQHHLIPSFNRFSMLNFLPAVVSRVLFRQRWKELLHLREEQKRVFTQLIEARKEALRKRLSNDKDDQCCNIVCYVDTLLGLELPDEEEKRKLDEGELVSLCSEFLSAGTDTTSTALEWVMANLVKHTRVQMRLVEEIGSVMGDDREGKELVKEEDLDKLPYLKAVILEGLRRHPPTHFLVPHAVTEDVVLNGYLVPKNGIVNFTVAEMGWDPKVWEDPMEFKQERFLRSSGGGSVELAFDIVGSATGRNNNNNSTSSSSEEIIKMMPFGAGRRICPAYNMAMLHLEYFVANLVWKFDWKALDGSGNIDLSEKQEFTVVMKHPLQARISPRTCTYNSSSPVN